MRRMKQLTALLMSVIMVLSMSTGITVPAMAANEDKQEMISSGTESIELEGNDSFGNMLAAQFSAQQAAIDSGSAIQELVINGTEAFVTCRSVADGDLVVAIYDENTDQMLASGTTAVSTLDGESPITVSITGDIPDHFVARAFLLDRESHEPLCKEYVSHMYTSEMQAFLDTTVADYDEDLVLNLDNDPNTNFGVYKEENVQADESAKVNVITDQGNGTYTISNADNTFTSLKAGDTFSYNYQDGTVLLVKAASVSVVGNKVVVKEDPNAELSDFFDYIKIEADSDSSKPTIDESEMSPELRRAPEPEIAPQAEASLSNSLNFSTNGIKIGNETISTSIGIAYTLSVSYYMTPLSHDFSLKLATNASVTISASGKIAEYTLDLPRIQHYILPGITAGFKPQFVFSMEAKVSWTGSIKSTLGVRHTSNDGFTDLCSAPTTESKFKLEGRLYVGFKAQPYTVIIDEKLGKASLDVKAGIEATATPAKRTGDLKHECDVCMDGDIYATISGSINVDLSKLVKHTYKIAEAKVKLGDFYYSITYDEYGLGSCPRLRYLVNVTVKDTEGHPLSGVSIQAPGMAEPVMTDNKGTATIYLTNGTHEVTASKDDISETKEVIVHDQKASVDIQLAASFASGDCGDHATWRLYGNGTLIISGTGPMWDKSVAGSYKNQIEAVVLEDGITRIGNSAFSGYSSLVTVTFDKDVTVIGNHAFENCTSLADAEIPDSVNYIGESAFSGCTSLPNVVIPGNVTSISANTFKSCTALTSVTIHDGVTGIGDSAFWGCSSLPEIVIPDSVKSIGGSAFWECSSLKNADLGNGVVNIGGYAFGHCISLPEVVIPDSVTVIQYKAFEGCSNLTNARIGNHVESIGGSAFLDCTNLLSLLIPDSVTDIGIDAFKNCTKMTSVTIGKGINTLNHGIFENCSGLLSIYFAGDCPKLASGPSPTPFTGVVATVYYPAGNSTWPDSWYSPVRNNNHDWGGASWLTFISWTPSAVTSLSVQDEAAEVAAVGVDAVEVDTDAEVVEEAAAVADADAEAVEGAAAGVDADAAFVAVPEAYSVESVQKDAALAAAPEAYSFESVQKDAAAMSSVSAHIGTIVSGTPKKAVFQNLASGASYVLLVVKDADAADLLAPDNLLYIAQDNADSDGNLTCKYIPRANESCTALAFGSDIPVDIDDPVAYGDVDGNGAIEASDALIILQFVVKLKIANEQQTVAADVDGNGRVEASDALALLQKVVKLIEKFPVEK